MLEQLIEMASDLILDGMGDAFERSPKEILWFTHRSTRRRTENVKSMAVSSRVSQAEAKDYEKFMKSI